MEASGCAVFMKFTKFDPLAAGGMVLARVIMILLALSTPWVPTMNSHSRSEYEQLPRGAKFIHLIQQSRKLEKERMRMTAIMETTVLEGRILKLDPSR
jgi:hypothetical protein